MAKEQNLDKKNSGVLMWAFIIGVVLILGIIFLTTSGSGEEYTEFAKCITNSGARMYGAFWCPHCKDQKAAFGSSWSEINYIECSTPDGQSQTPICTTAGIQGYPTWEFGDSTRASGFIPLNQLSQITGCALP